MRRTPQHLSRCWGSGPGRVTFAEKPYVTTLSRYQNSHDPEITAFGEDQEPKLPKHNELSL